VKSETVVITGASAGVGRATVVEFARRRARIGLIARGVERLEAAAREVELAGGKALVLPCDVADPGQVEAAAEQAEKSLGPIDIWVNNAMSSELAPFMEMTPEEFTRVNAVTYLGYVNGTRAALKRMIPRDAGTIVQVGSTLAYRSIPLQSAYCGAKHAIRGFTDSLRSELYHDRSKVRLTMVQLPALNTPQFDWIRSRMPRKAQPVPPIYQPEVAARAIYWASHHRRRELFVGLTTSIFIFGNKFFPGLGDRYLGLTGYEAQQTAEPEDPQRPDNLFEPVKGGYGAHGRFDDRSTETSAQLTAAMHPGFAFLAFLGLASLGRAAFSAIRGAAACNRKSANTR
jgi:NAD(P)-dependent dehydrogenase (short-subunit alcohol dehydrogenase family)